MAVLDKNPDNKKTNRPETFARMINSAMWVTIIITTIIVNGDYATAILIFSIIGWVYMDRSFKKELQKKGPK